jgi:hypothetical protein
MSPLQKDLGDQDANKAALIAHPLRVKSAVKKRRELPGPSDLRALPTTAPFANTCCAINPALGKWPIHLRLAFANGLAQFFELGTGQNRFEEDPSTSCRHSPACPVGDGTGCVIGSGN